MGKPRQWRAGAGAASLAFRSLRRAPCRTAGATGAHHQPPARAGGRGRAKYLGKIERFGEIASELQVTSALIPKPRPSADHAPAPAMASARKPPAMAMSF